MLGNIYRLCIEPMREIRHGRLTVTLITSERSELGSYWQSYMDRFDDIQTVLKLRKKNRKKC